MIRNNKITIFILILLGLFYIFALPAFSIDTKELQGIKEKIKEQDKNKIETIGNPISKANLYLQAPKNEIKTNKKLILVSGMAKNTSKLLINNKAVNIDDLTKRFSTKVTLNPGLNLITCIAYDANDIPLKVIRKVECIETGQISTQNNTVTQNLEEKARQYYYDSDYDEAIIMFKELLAKDTKRTDLYQDIGLSYFKLEKYKSAKEYLEKAKEYYPKDHKAYYNLASAYYALDMYKEAMDSYETAGKIQPMIKDLVNYKIGKTYYKIGKNDEAVTYLSKVIKSGTSDTITAAAKKVLSSINPNLYEKLTRPKKPLDLHFYLSGRRDNNATFSPVKAAITKDNLATFYFYTGFGWMIPQASPFSMNYTYYASDYAINQSRNLIGHIVSLGWRQKLKPTLYWRIFFDLSYYYLGQQNTFYFLGGKDTLYISSWDLKNQIIWKTPGLDNGWTYLEYSRTPTRFYQIYTHKEYEHTITLKQFLTKSWDTYFSYTNLNSIDARAYNALGFGGSWNRDLGWNSNIKFDLSLERFGYKAAIATGTASIRKDFRTTLDIALTKKFCNETTIGLNYQSVNNSSNDSVEKYNKQVTFLSLSKDF